MGMQKIIDPDGTIRYIITRGHNKGDTRCNHKPLSEEAKRKKSEKMKENWKNADFAREKLRKGAYKYKGCIKITNGVETRFHFCGEPIPDGWWRGITYKKSREEIEAIFKIANHYNGERVREYFRKKRERKEKSDEFKSEQN